MYITSCPQTHFAKFVSRDIHGRHPIAIQKTTQARTQVYYPQPLMSRHEISEELQKMGINFILR